MLVLALSSPGGASQGLLCILTYECQSGVDSCGFAMFVSPASVWLHGAERTGFHHLLSNIHRLVRRRALLQMLAEAKLFGSSCRNRFTVSSFGLSGSTFAKASKGFVC